MLVTLDASKGAQQMCESCWKRIFEDFNERKSQEEHECLPDRKMKGIENRWAILQGICNKFHGCHEKVYMRNATGKNNDMKMKDAHAMYVELNMDDKKPFKFMHVWSKIQSCPKWKS